MQVLPPSLEKPAGSVHIRVNIKHSINETPEPNDGWFPESGVERVHFVHWQNEQIEGDHGDYCIGYAPDGVIWFHDGKNRIAAVNEWRIRRYLYRGISWRFGALLRDYLGNGMIDVPAGSNVINFGANIGEVALALNRKGAHVLAIEPDPNVLLALNANARGRRINIAPCVAWHEDGDVDLHIATEKGDTSAINVSDDTIKVTARRLDTIEQWKSNPVHLLVGDAEGAEPEVLQGASETLTQTRYVSIRVGPERNGKCPGPECREILESAGFAILMDENEILIGENNG